MHTSHYPLEDCFSQGSDVLVYHWPHLLHHGNEHMIYAGQSENPNFPETGIEPRWTQDPARGNPCLVVVVLGVGVDISAVEEDFSPSEIKS